MKAAFDAHAAQAARLAARPEKPEAYEIKFPEGFKLPEGFEVFEKNPLFDWFRGVAYERGMTQQEFSGVLQGYAERAIAQEKAKNDAREAEFKKLGANASARVTAATTYLTSRLGDQQAKRLLGLLETVSDFESIEKLQLDFSSQGGGSVKGNGREPPAPPPQTIEQRWYPEARKAS